MRGLTCRFRFYNFYMTKYKSLRFFAAVSFATVVIIVDFASSGNTLVGLKVATPNHSELKSLEMGVNFIWHLIQFSNKLKVLIQTSNMLYMSSVFFFGGKIPQKINPAFFLGFFRAKREKFWGFAWFFFWFFGREAADVFFWGFFWGFIFGREAVVFLGDFFGEISQKKRI